MKPKKKKIMSYLLEVSSLLKCPYCKKEVGLNLAPMASKPLFTWKKKKK